MEIFENLDYALMATLEKTLSDRNINSSYKFVNFQNQVIDNVFLRLLGDEDARVRLAAAQSCVK